MDKDLGKLDLQNYKPLRDIVFETLREAIIEGQLKPGERLMEVQLSERLGVSRTPVREAIRKLELEGLVIMVPRKGAYVAEISLNDIIDVLEIRAIMEGLAASLAAKRITEAELQNLKSKLREFQDNLLNNNIKGIIETDTQLHDVIFKATRNKKLIELGDNLREQVQRFRIIYVNNYNKSTKLLEEHKKIVVAIEKGDAERAKKYAEEHINLAQKFLVNQAKRNSI